MSSEKNSVLDRFPYVSTLAGKTLVLKIGGELCEDAAGLSHLAKQCAVLQKSGCRLVIVHGGGKRASALASRLGVENKFVRGRRVTSPDMLEVAKMAFAGVLNTDVVAALLAAGIMALGLTGLDGNMISASKEAPATVPDTNGASDTTIDYGLVGEIVDVNLELLQTLLTHGYVPVICSLASNQHGLVLNLNADTLACRIAATLGVEQLIILGTVDGVLANPEQPSSVYHELDLAQLQDLAHSTKVSGGMIPKLETCAAALTAGVSKIRLVNGLKEDAILRAVGDQGSFGTLICKFKRPASKPRRSA